MLLSLLDWTAYVSSGSAFRCQAANHNTARQGHQPMLQHSSSRACPCRCRLQRSTNSACPGSLLTSISLPYPSHFHFHPLPFSSTSIFIHFHFHPLPFSSTSISISLPQTLTDTLTHAPLCPPCRTTTASPTASQLRPTLSSARLSPTSSSRFMKRGTGRTHTLYSVGRPGHPLDL